MLFLQTAYEQSGEQCYHFEYAPFLGILAPQQGHYMLSGSHASAALSPAKAYFQGIVTDTGTSTHLIPYHTSEAAAAHLQKTLSDTVPDAGSITVTVLTKAQSGNTQQTHDGITYTCSTFAVVCDQDPLFLLRWGGSCRLRVAASKGQLNKFAVITENGLTHTGCPVITFDPPAPVNRSTLRLPPCSLAILPHPNRWHAPHLLRRDSQLITVPVTMGCSLPQNLHHGHIAQIVSVALEKLLRRQVRVYELAQHCSSQTRLHTHCTSRLRRPCPNPMWLPGQRKGTQPWVNPPLAVPRTHRYAPQLLAPARHTSCAPAGSSAHPCYCPCRSQAEHYRAAVTAATRYAPLDIHLGSSSVGTVGLVTIDKQNLAGFYALLPILFNATLEGFDAAALAAANPCHLART